MKSQSRLRLRRPITPEACMPRVGGKAFRCQCGANVFTKKSDPTGEYAVVFACNGCQRVYA